MMQGALGNQHVQRLFRARLTARPSHDSHERGTALLPEAVSAFMEARPGAAPGAARVHGDRAAHFATRRAPLDPHDERGDAPCACEGTDHKCDACSRSGDDTRCSMDGPCPGAEEGELVDYQGSGETRCDPATGNMTTSLTEHCAGDCVAQHEAVHRRDRGPCCRRFKTCLDGATTDAERAECTNRFNDWFPRLSDWTECNAYTKEVSCLSTFIAANCGADAGGTSAACCTTLRGELTFAQSQAASRCAGATNVPCPF